MRDEGSNPHRSSKPAGDYLRQVRQIRVQFAGQPAEMQRRLKQLADARDREVGLTPRPAPQGARHRDATAPNPFAYTSARPSERPSRVLGVSSEVAELFATEVEAAIEAGLLRFTERRRLIARAQRLGMSRFDANLVIASVLNAQPAPLDFPAPATRRWRMSSAVAVFLAAEAVVIAGAVWALCH